MLGAIIAVAPFAVKLAEVIFHKLKPGEKAGNDKLDLASQILRLVGDKLEAGSGPKPTDDAIRAVVETALAQLQGTGALEAAVAEPALLPVPRSAQLPTEETIYVIVGGRVATVTKPA